MPNCMGGFMRAALRLATVALLSGIAMESFAASQAQIDEARNKGLAWLIVNQGGDGSWKVNATLGIQATSSALEALLNAGIRRGFSFAAGQSWLTNAEAVSTDSLSRQSATLSQCGADVSALTSRLVAMRNARTKSWGAYHQYLGSFPDTSLAMDAMYSTGTSYADTSTTLGFINGRQNADGGWSYVVREPFASQSREIPTAHTAIMLSHYKAAGWGVDTYLTRAVNWLVSRQKSDGGFAEEPSASAGNAYDTALVLRAFTEAKNAGNTAAIAAQAVIDRALDFLVAGQGADGSWEQEPIQTALALLAFPGVTLTDSDGDGIPDGVETILATDPLKPDGRVFAKGNGVGINGVTVPVFIASALLDAPFSETLTASGGTPPYSWQVTGGYLPQGLALGSATGTISGTPTLMGTFTFTYSATDSLGTGSETVGQIAVDRARIRAREPAITYYSTLNNAYAAQPPGAAAVIEIMAGTVAEEIVCDRNVSVILRGGFDELFSTQAGETVLSGSLTVIDGEITVDGVSVQ